MGDEEAYREKKILSIIKQEIQDGQDFAARARKMVEYLLLEKKGYAREEVEANCAFEVNLGEEKNKSSVDFLVTAGGRKAMMIKCFAGSLVSRERQAIAAARVMSQPPVPIAVVADPENAEVLDVITGKVIGEGFGAIPIRDQIVGLISQKEPKELSPERIEKEKRILLAFDAIACCVPQGGEGGVDIGPEPKKQN